MSDASDLSTSVQARLDDNLLKQLTRQNDPDNIGSIDTTYLEVVCGDAIARFQMETGVAYNSSQDWHVPVAVLVTKMVLHEYAGQYEAAEAVQSNEVVPWMERVREQRGVAVVIDSNDDKMIPVPIDTSTRTNRRDFDPNDQGVGKGIFPEVRGSDRS